MSENSSKPVPANKLNWRRLIGLPAWVLASYGLANLVAAMVILLLQATGLGLLEQLNSAVLNSVIAAVTYILMLVIAIGVPWWIKQRRTSRQDLGLDRLPNWLDIGIAPATFAIYFIASGLLVYLVTTLVSGFDPTQTQSIGFEDLTANYELVLAFLTLVVAAPVAEEILVRGYLYGKLRRTTSVWLAALVTSVMFAALHLPGAEGLQWNAAVDVFTLSIFLCILRDITGSIWAGILLHSIKNGIAYYFLFINPSLMNLI